MRLLDGALRKAPDDGVLHLRFGARRWAIQVAIISLVMFIVFLVALISFFQQNLAVLIVFLLMGCLGLVVLLIFLQPCAWLGLDLNLPYAFDVSDEGLEVMYWRRQLCHMNFGRADVQDFCVFSAAAEADRSWSSPRPIANLADVEGDLPRLRDVLLEGKEAARLCCASSRVPPGVACAFLAAKVQGEEETIQLTRCVWRSHEVDELFTLARAVRERCGCRELGEEERRALYAKKEEEDRATAQPPREVQAPPPATTIDLRSQATGDKGQTTLPTVDEGDPDLAKV